MNIDERKAKLKEFTDHPECACRTGIPITYHGNIITLNALVNNELIESSGRVLCNVLSSVSIGVYFFEKLYICFAVFIVKILLSFFKTFFTMFYISCSI